MIPISIGRHGEIFAVRSQSSDVSEPATGQGSSDAFHASYHNDRDYGYGSKYPKHPRLEAKEVDDPEEQTDRPVDAQVDGHGGLLGWRAVKLVYGPQDGRGGFRPHNIVREAGLMRRMSMGVHRNIATILEYTYDPTPFLHRLEMPLYACTLSDLFKDSSFPFRPPSLTSTSASAIASGSHGPEHDHLLSLDRCSGAGSDAGSIFGADLGDTVSITLIHALLSAVRYIHTLDSPIAHRDINPSNLLIDWNGGLKLGDFGTAFVCQSAEEFKSNNESRRSRGNDRAEGEELREAERGADEAWAEGEGTMCYDVGTGSYRAPELLFSSTNYDPTATDLWATGCIIAQFFRPYILESEVGSFNEFPSSESDTNSDSDRACESYSDLDMSSSSSSSSSALPPSQGAEDKYDPLDDTTYPSEWHVDARNRDVAGVAATAGGERGMKGSRKPLFNPSFGSLGLAASIFKVLGTPTKENWPDFGTLPDAGKFEFPSSGQPGPLSAYLPELGKLASSADGSRSSAQACLVDVISGLLGLNPRKRISADRALSILEASTIGWAVNNHPIPRWMQL